MRRLGVMWMAGLVLALVMVGEAGAQVGFDRLGGDYTNFPVRSGDPVEADAPALVLADFVMPGADGAWLIRSLRAEGGAVADVPVVLTTGSSAGREIAASLGILALEKPFDMNRLLDVVRKTARTTP